MCAECKLLSPSEFSQKTLHIISHAVALVATQSKHSAPQKRTAKISANLSLLHSVSDTPGTGTGYGEYTPPAEAPISLAAAKRIGAAMSAAAKRTYAVIPAAQLYPTSGASDDYAYSRHFADTSKNLLYGYTIEFGFGNTGNSCPFYPTQAQHTANLQEIGAGFMETVLAGVDLGLGSTTVC